MNRDPDENPTGPVRRGQRERPRQPPRRRPDRQRIEEIEERLAATERYVSQLEHAVSAITHEVSGISIGEPCACGVSLQLVRPGMISCPACGYRRTI